MGVMHGDEAVRVWRADVGAGALCMHGTTASYAVDPVGEYVLGLILAGGMRVRRGHEVHLWHGERDRFVPVEHARALAAAAGGVHGMIEDYVTCCTAWGFDLREVLGEVHLWHGERDRFVPVEHARALAAALPRCRAQFDAQDGHFFFRRRVAEVLGALVAAARRDVLCAYG